MVGKVRCRISAAPGLHMANIGLKLSILDQSPASECETAAEAFQHTIELATKAEQWGYHRFWVAEHHGSKRNMGSSPEVLISHLLAKTQRIRIGSGGVMLQHYSPYKVAENFNVLASLAPGRVDLGIGRGPGGLPRSTRALQRESGADTQTLAEKLHELEQFLNNHLDEDHPLHGLQTSPKPPQPADLFLLGTSPSSAELAASRGMPYVFALFLNSDETAMYQSIETYRQQFDESRGTNAQAILALPIIVADTDDEAQQYASEVKVVRIHLESGRTLTVTSQEAAEEFGRQTPEKFTFTVHEAAVVHGCQETVRKKLRDIQAAYQVEEIIAVTAIGDFQKRLHSYELLSGALVDQR